MLDATQIYNNKIKFLELLSKLNIDLTELVKYLDKHDYFNKPASAQFLRAYPGGLCQYALDLYYELAQLVNAYCPGKYTEEDVCLYKQTNKKRRFGVFLFNNEFVAPVGNSLSTDNTLNIFETFFDLILFYNTAGN